MNRKKACLFVMLMLPNIVFAQGITTAISGLIGTYLSYVFPGSLSAYVGFGTGLAGVVYAPQFDLEEDGKIESGHEQNSTKRLKKHANKASKYTCALVSLGVGLSAGWIAGDSIMIAGSSMIELIKSSL
jgi:hypothetical protein